MIDTLAFCASPFAIGKKKYKNKKTQTKPQQQTTTTKNHKPLHHEIQQLCFQGPVTQESQAPEQTRVCPARKRLQERTWHPGGQQIERDSALNVP